MLCHRFAVTDLLCHRYAMSQIWKNDLWFVGKSLYIDLHVWLLVRNLFSPPLHSIDVRGSHHSLSVQS